MAAKFQPVKVAPAESADAEPTTIYLKEYLKGPVDEYCRRHELKRNQVILKALRRFLGAELADDPDFWQPR